MTRLLTLFAMLLSLAAMTAPARAESYDNVVQAELRPGWRLPNGDHMAALHLRLAPGWKTYWRSPGEAGIPPEFQWRGTRNTRAITPQWPAPVVFWQSGMRSIGYKGELVLPLRVSLKDARGDARLSGVVDIGICKDVCMPHRVRVSVDLPAKATRPDPVIAAALANLPFPGAEAGVRGVSCRIAPAKKGVGLEVAIDMPRGTGREETVIETPDPALWVADPDTGWSGGRLVARTTVRHASGGAIALDRSALRITVLGGSMPVEIKGCTG
ncbi:protein-disulfide reductase DsbD domain-containing protein [Ponticoccus sp. (in: a-proteobacteria)]|uniref:protein-disulfide reductase DsbD domain-containing protein n=1 Tax=Ponticoccus sp. (in: a-proteobacteria) TaxID=1925025 RepID=UPI003AB853AD